MSKIAYTNARLLDPESKLDIQGTLLTEGDTIIAMGESVDVPADAEIIDCDGNALAPGIIDMRVFVGEPGNEHKETIETASHAAAAGGVTTMVVQPETDPVVDNVSILEMIARRARKVSHVRVEAMGAITRGLQGEEMAEIALLQQAGAVAFSDGNRAIRSSTVMRRALAYAANLGALIVTHAEDAHLADGGVMHEGTLATRLGLPGIPAMAEVIGVERDVRLVELTGAPCHISQISSAKSLEVIEAAKLRGLPISCGVSANHLSLNENDIGDYRTFLRLSPPLRTEDDRLALVGGVRRGMIDVVHSCHQPEDAEAKRQPFEDAAVGAVGLETLLASLLSLYHTGDVDLLTALNSITARPAQLLGLEEGRLKVGGPADMVLIDLDAPWVLDADKLKSKSKNTAFEGRRLQGRAIRTIVRGETVFQR